MSQPPLPASTCHACLSEPAITANLGAGCLARIAHDAASRAVCWDCRSRIPTHPGGSCEVCQRACNARVLRNAHATLDADEGPLTAEDFDPTEDEYYFAPGIRNERRAPGGRRGGE